MNMVCPHCRIGRYQLTRVPYARWLDGCPLVVSRLPAYVCDFCGDLEYDSEAMLNVQYLIHQHEVRGKRPSRQRPQAASGPQPGRRQGRSFEGEPPLVS